MPEAAKNRLTDMVVQEVSLVDKAANRTTFAVRKRDGADPTEKKMTTKRNAGEKIKALKALVAKLALKLPKAAKQTIMDGLAESLDKLTALTAMVGDAEVDDAAAVPPELAAALVDAGEQIEAIAEQFGGPPEERPEGAATGGEAGVPGQGANAAGQSEGAPGMGMKSAVGKAVQVTKTDLDAFTAAKTTLDAAQAKLWDASRLMTEDPAKASSAFKDAAAMITSASAMLGGGSSTEPEQMAAAGKALGVAKELPKELRDGDGMGTELHDGDNLSQIMRKSVAEANMLAGRVEKAGRKMAKDRYAKLAAMHDALGKLLNELAYDGAAEKAGARAPDKAEGAQQKVDAGGGTGDFGGKPDPTKAPKVDAAPTGKGEAVERLEKALASAQEAQVALAKRLDEVAKVAGGGPASGSVEKSGGDAGTTEAWPLDMSADLAKRRADKKVNGAAG